jgi:Legionella pneumophila major outer membrane protein precursor
VIQFVRTCLLYPDSPFKESFMNKYGFGWALILATAASPMITTAALAENFPGSAIAQTPTAPKPSSPELLEKLQRLEQKQQELEQEIGALRQQLGGQPTTAAVTVPENQPQSFEFSTQVVFLRPTTTNTMDFAIVDPGTALATTGDIARVTYQDATALRYNATYRPANTAWEISASHMAFDTDGSQSAVRPATGSLFSTLTHPFQNDRADTATANAKLNYSATDAELAYRFKVGKSLGVRLFGGLRFADVTQAMTVDYNGRDFNNGRAKIDTGFSGFGPRMGLEARLMLGQDFSLFGKGSGSLLRGKLSTSYAETDNNGADLVAQIAQSRDQQIVPVVDLSVGLSWQPQISKNANLHFAVGYEYQQWFRVTDTIRFVNSSSPGIFSETSNDLSLHGFFLQLGLSAQF